MNVKVRNRNIHYIKKGTSSEICLLVHGWGGSAKSLQELQDLLSTKFTTVAIDLPGFGESDLPDKDWGIFEYGDLLVDFINKLELNNCLYIGHSFGGALGIYIAANYPNAIKKLVLCAPSFAKRPLVDKKRNSAVDLYKKLNLPEYQTLRRIFYRIFYPASDLPKFPKLESNFKKIISEDLTTFAQRVKQETLILWGDKDNYISVDYSKILKENITNSKVVIFTKAKHGFPIFNPEYVFNEVTKFLNI